MPVHRIYIMWNRAKYSGFKYCIITDCSLYHQTADKMHTEQMRKHICIPCSPDWGNWLDNRSYRIGTRSVCLGHVKLSALRNSKTVSKTTSVQLNKNHLFLGNAGNFRIITPLLEFLFRIAEGKYIEFLF